MKNEWWRGAVIYQIYPRSYKDSNGDGVGDLKGIAEKLDYVADLGVDAIWISPFFKSPMKDFGYDVSDYRDVDPVFGTIDDFKGVLKKAHDLGIKVMIDQVWSHSSDQHAWFRESRRDRNNPRHDWYIWADPKPDGTAPNNWLSYFGGPAWTWDSRREQYYLHQFLSSQPTLNLWHPDVRREIKDIAAFWLDMGVDGFRLDAIHTYLSDRNLRDNPARTSGASSDIPSSNPLSRQIREYTANLAENYDWAEELRAFVNKWPERCLLAETGGEDSEAAAASYVQTGKRFHLAYTFGLVGSDMNKQTVLHVVNRVEELINDGWICWAVSNHDFKRVVGRIPGKAPDRDKALFAMALGLSLRGSYCLYQGEELGLPQADLAFEDLRDPYDIMLYPEHVGRDGCRTPMPWESKKPHAGFSMAEKTWLPVPAAHHALAAGAQREDKDSVLHRFKDFLAWRKQSAALRLGEIEILETPDPVLAFRRTQNGENIVCVYNCSDITVSLDSPARGPRKTGNNATVEQNTLSLGPYGYALFEE